APADEDVAVRQDLRVAFEGDEQSLRMAVALDQRDALRSHVDTQAQDPRELLDRRSRAIVEERDRAVALAARVVLPLEVRAGAHLEVALLAADTPEHLLRGVADLVQCV